MKGAIIIGVTDIFDRLVDCRLVVEVGVGGDFATEDNQVILDHGFTSDPGCGVLFEAKVKDVVADGIGNFVWVALVDRL